MSRSRRSVALVLVLAAVLAAGGWWAVQPVPHGFSVDDIRTPLEPTVEVAPRLFLIPGGGCNTAVFITATGVVLVDVKYAVSWPDLLARVRRLTDKPITHVINTHFHGDHTGADPLIPPGAEIVAHERTALHLSQYKLLPLDGNGRERPVITYRDRLTLFSGEDEIELYGVGPSHTDGDTFVIFKQARVMSTGDVFGDKMFPVIHLEGGGDAVGLPRELARAAASITGVDRIIPGHGPLMQWSDLAEYADFTQVLVDYVRAEMHFGADKNQVFKAFKMPPRFASYNTDRQFDTLDEIDRTIRPRWQRIF